MFDSNPETQTKLQVGDADKVACLYLNLTRLNSKLEVELSPLETLVLLLSEDLDLNCIQSNDAWRGGSGGPYIALRGEASP